MNYESMYKKFSKEKRGYEEDLKAVVISSNSLELIINGLVKLKAEKLPSIKIDDWLKNTYISISNKIRLLRFADLIDESFYKTLDILFKIRNDFAHKLAVNKNVFDRLNNIEIEDEFIKKLPNDSIKFELVVCYCICEFIKISEKIDPNSVLHSDGIFKMMIKE